MDERFIPQSTLEEVEEDYYYDQEMKFVREGEKAIMKRPCLMTKKKIMDIVDDDTTERLKRFITGEMYGLDMKLVIQKPLYESDLSINHNRLNMPIKQLVTHPDEFLTDDERRMTDEHKEGIEVRVVGPTLQMYEKPMWLKKWQMRHNGNYVLKTNWNNFVAANQDLAKRTMIQVWSFRKERQLCFAIIPVKKPDALGA